MTTLIDKILAEEEIKLDETKNKEPQAPRNLAYDSFHEIMKDGLARHPKTSISFSGGSDSLVLLDLLNRIGISPKPKIIWVDTQMEYPGTKEFVQATVAAYGLDLRIAKADRTPTEQWQKTGWPMLGKMSARIWMQKNKHKDFKINVSECCRNMKIKPGRTLAKNLGCGSQITGQRGKTDDLLRAFRDFKEGAVFLQKRDNIWMINPLQGWRDEEIQGYIKSNKLKEHPARKKGAKTIGCVFCGGGSQYTNSGFRILRKLWPEAWFQFMVLWGAGFVVLALKYDTTVRETQDAVKEFGGLKALAFDRPWVFDFTRETPLQGYDK